MTTPGHAEPGRFRGETLPDLVGPHTRLLFVGVNPGLSAVAVQAPFPRRGNRFYPALFKAGITDRRIDASAGFAPGDREYLTDRGIGITALVSRATARAAELSTAELRAGAGPAHNRQASQAASSRHSGDHRVPHRLHHAESQPAAARTVRRNQLWVVPNPRASTLTPRWPTCRPPIARSPSPPGSISGPINAGRSDPPRPRPLGHAHCERCVVTSGMKMSSTIWHRNVVGDGLEHHREADCGTGQRGER